MGYFGWLEVKKINLAVLISGRGSNLKAIMDNITCGYLYKADLKVVISDHSEAQGLKFAKDVDIPTRIIWGENEILPILKAYNIDLVAMAGFDMVVSKKITDNYPVMNIHPSLLPAFGGTMHAQLNAWHSGVKISGCTVHFATEDVDGGPIIIQAAVPVLEGDTAKTLADRILKEEHQIYPKAIKLFCDGKLKIVGRKVKVKK